MRVVLRIEIPALDAYVAFLKAATQAQIDATTAEVAALTARLKKTNAALKAAEQNSKEK